MDVVGKIILERFGLPGGIRVLRMCRQWKELCRIGSPTYRQSLDLYLSNPGCSSFYELGTADHNQWKRNRSVEIRRLLLVDRMGEEMQEKGV